MRISARLRKLRLPALSTKGNPIPTMSTLSAFYRLEISVISRSQGRSAVASSAYRSGRCLADECDFQTQAPKVHNYRYRSGVVATGIMIPENAPIELHDRQTLWNAAERAEKRKNARTAREALIGLPHQLSDEERKQAVIKFCAFLIARYGVAVDYAIHRPDRRADRRNHHAHIMFTTRTITENGLGTKTRSLDDKTEGAKQIQAIREEWERICNQAFKNTKRPERVTAKSLKARNINRLPEPKQGYTATRREREGKMSKAGEERWAIQAYNAVVKACTAQEQENHIRVAKNTLRRIRKRNKSPIQWLVSMTAYIWKSLKGTLRQEWRNSIDPYQKKEKLSQCLPQHQSEIWRYYFGIAKRFDASGEANIKILQNVGL